MPANATHSPSPPIHPDNTIARNYLHICTCRLLNMLAPHQLEQLQALYRHTATPPEDSADPAALPARTITWTCFSQLLALTDRDDLIPGVGLQIGSRTQLADLGTLGYASQTSPTFWESLNVVVPFSSLLGWDVRIRHTDTDSGDTQLLLDSMDDWNPCRAELELWAMVAFTGVERLIGLHDTFDPAALKFYFPYPEPAHIHLYHQLFKGAQLIFNQNFCAWRYPQAWKDLIVPGHDASLSTFCVQQLLRLNQHQIRQTDCVHRLKNYLYLNFDQQGFPTMPAAAAHLNMSTATLRRKLKNAGITYEKMVESMRRNMATHLLLNSTLTVEEIAYKLGYNYPSNFYAAFKTWFGCSARQYRLQHSATGENGVFIPV